MTAPHERAGSHHALPQLMEAIPKVETARLTLRAPQLQDFPVLVDINEELAARSLRQGAGTREGAWSDFVQMSATWIWRGHGWWTIETSDTSESRAIGFVGIGFEPGDLEPELGYLLRKSAYGKGYATEAAQAACDCAFGRLKLQSLVSYIAQTNEASQGVAQKLGAARDFESEARLNEDGVQVWRHTNPYKKGSI